MPGPIEDLTDIDAWKARLGTHVTVRFETGEPQHPFGSSAGLLQSVGSGPDGEPILVLLTRKGEERHVSVASVTVAKEI